MQKKVMSLLQMEFPQRLVLCGHDGTEFLMGLGTMRMRSNKSQRSDYEEK